MPCSREKVRLTDQIQRAEAQVQRCKEVLRDCVKACEEAQGDVAISDDAFDEEGEVDAAFILCSRCQDKESYDDNDIVLCDGPCNRAYHEQCVQPRLIAADLPEDEGWLCPGCDAKVGCKDKGGIAKHMSSHSVNPQPRKGSPHPKRALLDVSVAAACTPVWTCEHVHGTCNLQHVG